MQRVAIARALVNDPAVIFADEPTGNLDSATSEMVLNTFKSMQERGKTIVLITHDPETAFGLIAWCTFVTAACSRTSRKRVCEATRCTVRDGADKASGAHAATGTHAAAGSHAATGARSATGGAAL